MSVVDFELYLSPKNISYLDSGYVTVSKTVRGQFYSVTHGDLETAKKMLKKRIKINRNISQHEREMKKNEFQELIRSK